MTIDIAPVPVPDDVRTAPIPFDLYREVHKGLRLALFELTVAVGRAGCDDPAERADVIARTRSVIALLHAHHHHEDAFIQRSLAAVDPRLSVIVDAGHVEVEQDLIEIELLLERLADCEGIEGVAVGLDLYRYLALFTARYLAHMALEEGAVMEALRNGLTLDELFGIEVAIRSTIAPPLMVELMEVMLPAMNPDERTAMLGGMRAGAPAEVFELFRHAAQRVLSGDDYAVAAARIGVA